MKLKGFKELLAKKTDDPFLLNTLEYIQDDQLLVHVVESLEKMARSKHRGDAANLALRDFGVEMDPEHEPNMIHDALSHHASR